MRRTLILVILGFLLTSCGTTYQLSTLNHDPIYGPDGTEIKVDTIDSEFQLARKFRTDDRFRWDFAQYAMNQDLRWHYDFYWNNRMYRGPFASPFDFYWNSNQYWWNWSSNYSFNYGFNHWNRFGFYGYGSSFGYYGFNRYGWNGYGSPWNDWGYRQRMNDYAWENRNRTNTAYVVGRRGSNNVITNSNRTNIENRIIVNRNKPRLVDKDVVIDKALIKLRGNNTNIRVYNNPNNVPPVIIRNNNNSKPIRNYNRVENNSNNNIIRNNNNNIRRTPPPTRSSNPPVINRSSSSGRSGGNVVIKRQ